MAGEFARMLASYSIIRVLQEFPAIKLVSSGKTGNAVIDRHNLDITMSSADGCQVLLNHYSQL